MGHGDEASGVDGKVGKPQGRAGSGGFRSLCAARPTIVRVCGLVDERTSLPSICDFGLALLYAVLCGWVTPAYSTMSGCASQAIRFVLVRRIVTKVRVPPSEEASRCHSRERAATGLVL